ncbi:hypothetical protein [Actinoplanes utahensis]|uniref:Uncharacterized protein n=1 Tax=Actinoplanes utahensis TaxID=1869 RepID=A0A0A6X4S8_ACTUT|nr:hypothetical protein [Actinoplanes utahensis]KHD75112.1 hypothetical protein MB27_24630 [Actinoplanes utahensis]GIF27051.1 hypothetical protein Aut01nite_00370 [Actinoplanes utahensis]
MIIVVLPRSVPITVDTLLASALAEQRPADRVHAIADLVPHLGAGQRDRIRNLAVELPDEHLQQILIEALLPYLDIGHLAAIFQPGLLSDLDTGHLAALSRSGPLIVLAPRLSRRQQEDLIEGLLAEVEAGRRDAGSLTTLRPLLSTGQASRIGRLLLAGDDPERAVQDLRIWAPVLPAEIRSAALALARTVHSDDWTLARLLENDWIPHLSPDEARRLLPMAAALNSDARAEVLPALTAVLPEVAPAAVEALRHGRGTGRGIVTLARALAPADRGELLRILLPPPVKVLVGEMLRPLVPLLDEDQVEWVLRVCETSPYPDTWLDAAALCLPYLSGPRRADVQDRVVERMTGILSIRSLPRFTGPLRDEQYDGVSEPRRLLPTEDLLREDQYRALIPYAFALPFGDAVGLVTLAHELDRGHRDAALGIVDRLEPPSQRTILVRALAPFLDDDQIEIAATLPALADAEPDELVPVFTALAVSAVDDALHARLTATAMKIIETVYDGYRHGCMMVDVAAVCRTEPARQHALHAATRPFPELTPTQRLIIRRRIAALLTGNLVAASDR